MVTAQQRVLPKHSIDLPCNTWVAEGQIDLTDADAAHEAAGHGLTDRTGITFEFQWEYRGQNREHSAANPPYPRPMTWNDDDRANTIYALEGLFFSHRRGIWGRPLKHGSYPFRVRVEAKNAAGERIGVSNAFDLTVNCTGHSAILLEEEYVHHSHGHGGHNHHHMHHGTEESAALKTVHDELRAIRVRLGALENPAVHSDTSDDDSE